MPHRSDARGRRRGGRAPCGAAAAHAGRDSRRRRSWPQACGSRPGDIESGSIGPASPRRGNPFLFAELKSRAALARPRAPDRGLAQAPADGADGRHPSLCRRQEHGVEIQTRMFAPLFGVPEDPATGGANVDPDRPSGPSPARGRSRAGQDDRPGLRHGPAEHARGLGREEGRHGDATYIGGRCVPMMRGTIDLA